MGDPARIPGNHGLLALAVCNRVLQLLLFSSKDAFYKAVLA